jgi:hypothetical protein
MDIELVPLCTIDATLAAPMVVGQGAAGMRVIFEVGDATVKGDRLSGRAKGPGADWVLLHRDAGTIDVRMSIETDDGAVVFVQYHGKVDVSGQPIRMRVAPRFETGDERYAWLNAVQAVGVGESDGTSLHYEWYEVR